MSSFLNIWFGLLALRHLGPYLFLKKLRYQLYSQIPVLCLGKDLDRGYPSPGAYKKITVLPASSVEVAKFFKIMATESKESQYELLVRRRFYKKGFHDCCIGRTNDSNEMCSIVWMVTSSDVAKTKSQNSYPGLGSEEIYGENIYVPERFRGKGVMNATGIQHEEIARKRGFKRILFHVKEDNIQSLKSSITRGHLIYRKVLYCRFFFRVRVKTIDRFNPAIPIIISYEN